MISGSEEDHAMELRDIASRDPEVMSGALVFKDTRVPVDALFENLAAGLSLAAFLDDFPTVQREQAEAALLLGCQLLQRRFLSGRK